MAFTVVNEVYSQKTEVVSNPGIRGDSSYFRAVLKDSLNRLLTLSFIFREPFSTCLHNYSWTGV